MKTRILLAAIAMVALLAPTAAFAGDDKPMTRTDKQMTERQQSSMQSGFQPQLHRAQQLLGADVTNPQGEDLGSIKDLVTDPRRRQISYVVLSSGGILGLGDDLHAIPWDALQIQRQGDDLKVVLNATEEQIENAVGFDDDHWPNAGNPRWSAKVSRSFYGEKDDRPQTAMKQSRTRETDDLGWDDERLEDAIRERELDSRRLAELMDDELESPNGELGDIEDILIDGNRGELAYLLVEADTDVLDIDDKRVAVPWDAVQVRNEELYVDAQRPELQRMAFRDMNQLEDEERVAQVHREVQFRPYWEGGDRERQEQQDRRYGYASRDLGMQTMAVIGKVTKVEHQGERTTLHVKSDDGMTYNIDAGEQNKLQRLSLKQGDQVSIMGRKTEARGTDTPRLVAQVISKGEAVRVENDEMDRRTRQQKDKKQGHQKDDKQKHQKDSPNNR